MPHKFQILFKNRDFTTRDPLTLDIEVTEYSFAAKGGPYRAQLEATGNIFALWALFNDLRCPVEIYDELGVRVWWGMVYELELWSGKLQFKASLADVFNKVSVGYSYIATGTQEVGQRKTTTPVSDVNSQAEYGTKELVQLSGGMADAEANALAAGLLAKYSWPKGGLTASNYTVGSEAKAIIYLRGWWDTAFWQYASKTTTASTETSVQIKDLLATYAPLLSAVEMDASAISSSNYKDGSKLVGSVVEEMAAASSVTGLDCTIWVDANRLTYIAREPASTTINYLMDDDGALCATSGEPVRNTTPPVGVYVKTADIIPAVVNQTIVKDSGVQFIVESGYRRGEAYYIFRDSYYTGTPAPRQGVPTKSGLGDVNIQNTMLPMVADWINSNWTTYTTTPGGITVGSGTLTAAHCRQMGMCDVRITFTLAADSAITGPVTFTLPFVTAETSWNFPIGMAFLLDVGTQGYQGIVFYTAASTVTVYRYGADIASLYRGSITDILPHTWATGDSINVVIRYRIA